MVLRQLLMLSGDDLGLLRGYLDQLAPKLGQNTLKTRGYAGPVMERRSLGCVVPRCGLPARLCSSALLKCLQNPQYFPK